MRHRRTGSGDGGDSEKTPRADGAQEELVARTQRGDANAFAELVRLHQDAIFGLVHRLTNGRETEELTQDVFLRAWNNIDRFRGESRFSTWLYRIAVNICYDHRAKRRVQEQNREVSFGSSSMSITKPASNEPTPDQKLEEKELIESFRGAVEALEPGPRAAFLLRHQEGLSMGEIAAILKISETNAKVRVHRARETVLTILRRRGHRI
jgi:RNA polymerase sigma-70 factor, ECF subfamily